MRANLVKIAAMGAVLSVAAISPASAALLNFTWNPNGATPVLGGTSFTANNMIVSDFSTIALSPIDATHAAFTDSGFLPITQFQLTGNPVITPGLNNLAATGGYGLYFQFTATGTQAAVGGNPIPAPSTTLTGTITSLTFQLIGYTIPGANAGAQFAFNASNQVGITLPGGSVSAVLAQGTLIPGTTTVSLAADAGGNLTPAASSKETFLPCTGAAGACTTDESGFFLAPPLNVALDIFDAFVNTSSVILSPVACDGPPGTECIGINGGGGNANLIREVPEPRSLALFGTGLLALGMLFMRRRKVSS